MFLFKERLISSFIFILLFSGIANFTFAVTCTSDTNGKSRDELQAIMVACEAEASAQEAILKDQEGRSDSLAKEIATLDATIKKYKLDIKARNIAIKQLTSSIGDKQETIDTLSEKIQKEKESLSEIIRKINEIDSFSFIDTALASEDVSTFFSDLDSFDSITESMQVSFNEILEDKQKTEDEKSALETKKNDQTELMALQELQQKRVQEQEAEKTAILKASKGLEANYQKIIKEKTLTATQIRNQLFSLVGSGEIPFPLAVQYANYASQKTGVRAAFILGIIAEESNLGKNIGTGNWRTDMKAPRDTVPFLAICTILGLDPDKMPVSKKAWYGWGGAMGPAQFIPSTWVLYGGFKKDGSGNWYYDAPSDKIRNLSGKDTTSNPWNPQDAFLASAILLKDNGAAKGGYYAENLAALRYLAGWTNATKSAYSFYGDDVMTLAAKYQSQINILGGS